MLALFPIHARTPSRFCDSPAHGRAFCQSGILITCRTSFLLSCDNDASLHHHPSSCRSETNERTTPTSVFNAFIARKFSKRQACGRTVVSTAKVCLCTLAASRRFHAISFIIGMGFFQLWRKNMIFDHHCFLKQSVMMNSGNPTHLLLHAHPKTLVSLVQQIVPTATLPREPKCFPNQTKSIIVC